MPVGLTDAREEEQKGAETRDRRNVFRMQIENRIKVKKRKLKCKPELQGAVQALGQLVSLS